VDVKQAALVQEIDEALRRRSGKDWEIVAGKGEHWGKIFIRVPLSKWTPSRIAPAEEAKELARLLDLDQPVWAFALVMPPTDYYQEYSDRCQGRKPEMIGEPLRAFYKLSTTPSLLKGVGSFARFYLAHRYPKLGWSRRQPAGTTLHQSEYLDLRASLYALLAADDLRGTLDYNSFVEEVKQSFGGINEARRTIRGVGERFLRKSGDLYGLASAMDFETHGRSRELLDQLWRGLVWRGMPD
jgi:hypothetical protein